MDDTTCKNIGVMSNCTDMVEGVCGYLIGEGGEEGV